MPRRKVAVNPFERRSRCRSPDGPDLVRDEEMAEASFSDLGLRFEPAAPRMECALTLQFKCNVKISRGDTVVLRLAGFKSAGGGGSGAGSTGSGSGSGHAASSSGIFALEHRGEDVLSQVPELLGDRTLLGVSAEEIRGLGAIPLKYFRLSTTPTRPAPSHRAEFLTRLRPVTPAAGRRTLRFKALHDK